MNINPNYYGAQYDDANAEENPNVDQNESHLERVQRASISYTQGTGPLAQHHGSGYMERAAASSSAHGTVPQFDAGFTERAAAHERGGNTYFAHSLRQSFGAGSSAANLMPPSAPRPPDYRRIFDAMPQFAAGADLNALSNVIGIRLPVYFTPEGNYTESGRLFYQALDGQEQATLDNAIAMRQQTIANLYNPAPEEPRHTRRRFG